MNRKKSSNLKDALPLRPVEMMVLMTISSEGTFGVSKSKDARPTDRPVAAHGSLQRVISLLLSAGLIAHTVCPSQPDQDNPERHYYRVSLLGRTVLRSDADRRRKLLGQVEALDLVGDGLFDTAAGF